MQPSLSIIACLLATILAGISIDARELLATSSPMCASMGTTTLATSKPLPACKTYYSTGAAIRVPKDVPALKYGMINFQNNPASPCTFISRTGASWNFKLTLIPKDITINSTNSMFYSQLVMEATFRNGSIAALKPILFIEEQTMIKPFLKTKFIGTVNNMDPPAGIPTSAWMRWDFGSSFSKYELGLNTIQALSGRFSNLRHNIQDGKTCRPALCANSTQCSWYTEFFGKSESMQLYWNPAMHFPGDSEFVPVFSNQITYMSGAPRAYELLAGNVNLTRPYTFIIHGTPIATPASFTGRFSHSLSTPDTC